MRAIGPGDWVECVDASPTWAGSPVPFVVGGVYLVVDVGVVPKRWTDCGAPHLIIAGHPNPYNGLDVLGWDPDRFRPIYRPKENAFDHLLQPVKEGVSA